MYTKFPFKKFSCLAPILGMTVTVWSVSLWMKWLPPWEVPEHWPRSLIIGILVLMLFLATLRSAYYAYGSIKMPEQFISLEADRLHYQIYPNEIGGLAYHCIRIISLHYQSSKSGVYKGRLNIRYLPEGLPEDMGNYQLLTLKLDYIYHPDKRWYQLQPSGTDLYLETILALEQALKAKIPAGQLYTELDYEKYQTRVWLNRFKT